MRAALSNIPTSPTEWALWGYAHRVDHLAIRSGIQSALGQNLPEYDLDPIPFDDLDAWLDRNQAAHTDMNTALGLQGSSLLKVDLRSPEETRAWFYLHAQEHIAAGFAVRV